MARPAAGYVTNASRSIALRSVLEEARRGTLPGMVRTGATFADTAAEWLRYVRYVERGHRASLPPRAPSSRANAVDQRRADRPEAGERFGGGRESTPAAAITVGCDHLTEAGTPIESW